MRSRVRKLITDLLVRSLKPAERRYEIGDERTPGFSVRVGSTGRITFYYSGRNSESRQVRLALGTYPDLSVKEARAKAVENRRLTKEGRDPRAEKRRAREEAALRATTEEVTLGDLIVEAEAHLARKRVTWRPRGKKDSRSNNRQVCERVYAPLLGSAAIAITEQDLASVHLSYKRARQKDDHKTANGQVASGRAYLSTVLNWASGRRKFRKVGAHRNPKLTLADMCNVVDPSEEDLTIVGERDRVLNEVELGKVLPLLRYPAPPAALARLAGDKDLRHVALRFQLYTMSRLDEVCSARWGDIDFRTKRWRKVVKSVGHTRIVELPLTDNMIELIRGVPTFENHNPEDLIFQNSAGGKLGNWDRITQIIQEVSGTRNWHRHDLRRSASTLARMIGCDPVAIDAGLCHADPLAATDTRASASRICSSHHGSIISLIRSSSCFKKLEEALAEIEEEFGVDHSGKTRRERLRVQRAARQKTAAQPVCAMPARNACREGEVRRSAPRRSACRGHGSCARMAGRRNGARRRCVGTSA
ncbi:MAG TPA: integrase family protein [Paracoccaceae bacterium]|nr:integrase family protein [Paracoccaceae bacterium]